MSNKKKELLNSNNALKESLENQIANLKDNFDVIGKNALWIGGGLVGAYGIIRLLNSGKKKKKRKVLVEQPHTSVEKKEKTPSIKSDNLLSSTVKEQLIIFLLGVATQKLTKFLTALEKDEVTNDSK